MNKTWLNQIEILKNPVIIDIMMLLCTSCLTLDSNLIKSNKNVRKIVQ